MHSNLASHPNPCRTRREKIAKPWPLPDALLPDTLLPGALLPDALLPDVPRWAPRGCCLAPKGRCLAHGNQSRAQNRHFCALLPSETPIFRLFEHKIGIFVSEWTIFPWFLPLPSTNSGFLCSGRGSSRGGVRIMASGSLKESFLQFIAHANMPQRCLEQLFVCAVICRNSRPHRRS